MYANDHQLFSVAKTANEAESILTEEGNNISEWYNNNLLQGNFSKYQVMSRRPRNWHKDLHIVINDTVIDQKPEITLLEVTLVDQLSFSSHVSNVCRKASSQTGVLLRLRNPIPTSAKLHIIKFAGYPISHTVKLSGISVVLLMPRNLNEFKNEHYALCTLTTNRRTMNSCMERMYQHFIRGDYKLLQS